MAKAVRIRIMSGGETHGSFESLLRNFCMEDVVALLKNGRLSVWLEKRGHFELKNALSEIGDFNFRDWPDSLKFCSYFFKYSENDTIKNFWSSGLEKQSLTKLIHLFLKTKGYERSARGIWEFSLPSVEDEYFFKWSKDDAGRLFEALKKYAAYENIQKKKSGYFHRNANLSYWFGLCNLLGIGTIENVERAKQEFLKAKDFYESKGQKFQYMVKKIEGYLDECDKDEDRRMERCFYSDD